MLAYVSFFDGELHIVPSLQCFQVSLELAIVEEDLLHHISTLDETKRLL